MYKPKTKKLTNHCNNFNKPYICFLLHSKVLNIVKTGLVIWPGFLFLKSFFNIFLLL